MVCIVGKLVSACWLAHIETLTGMFTYNLPLQKTVTGFFHLKCINTKYLILPFVFIFTMYHHYTFQNTLWDVYSQCTSKLHFKRLVIRSVTIEVLNILILSLGILFTISILNSLRHLLFTMC